MLKLFDTARGRIVPFEPREPGKVSMYVCGPTVYGPPHLGHGRFALVFDVLRRYLEWTGAQVDYVSNITDIDDKIIQRANDEGRDPAKIAIKCESIWYKAMDAIGVKRPTADPHATAYVDQMVACIADLVERGTAYETSDGVYFSAESVADYGLLARQDIEDLRSGDRVAHSDEKRSPIDFVLWKKAKPDEPTWDSPWGPGRPGWHTECVVMALDLLGEGFDLHGGGQDLAFPHHENERAQAVAADRAFATHWMHNGFVEVGGEKMSKSLGNYSNLLDLVAEHDPRAYRLLVLQSHYRSPLEITRPTIERAEATLERLDNFARRTATLPLESQADAETLARFRELMDDDLNTPGAIDLLFTRLRAANAALDMEDFNTAGELAAAVTEMTVAMGLVLDTGAGRAAVPNDILELATRRDAARAAKDFAAADGLRDEIAAAGYVVTDTADGAEVRPA